MGKGVVDERHPRFLGNAALSSGDFVHRAIEAADLIINIGHDVIEKPPFFMVRGGTEVIHISFRSAEVDAVYFPQVEVIGDIANAVWQISEALNDTAHWDFTRLMAIREANEARSPKAPTTTASRSTRSAWSPTSVARCRPKASCPGQRHLQDLVRP
jgi:Thiamine pyrophosphate-requiring enzymes [acetolactate synthase, pyruvate dehydrogenase (cytochrome), glyoxylate carboligase, phosphonopyruvate decarboxylase]